MYMLIKNLIEINLINYLINKYTKSSAIKCNILNTLLTILYNFNKILNRARPGMHGEESTKKFDKIEIE